jgi:AraC family transcriptional activator of tynA and feaB
MMLMRHVAILPERGHNLSPALYASDLHGERTQIEVFTRVSDHVFEEFALGEMGVIVLRCGSVSIRREVADIRARSNLMSTFIFQIRGRSAFSHYGNQIVLDEGDITLCNNSTHYDLRLDGPNELIMFRVPTPMIGQTIPSPELVCGRRLGREQGLASMATAMVRDLAANAPSRLAPDIGERAGRHLLDVLSTAYLSLLEERNAASAVMSARFSKMKLFIEEHLRDPALRPAFVARRMGVSDRYLRMIFAVGDESASSYILRRRLEECAAQLRDPRWQHHSITSIAFGWGFNSAPHFARSFSAQFCCSPSDYRHQKLS